VDGALSERLDGTRRALLGGLVLALAGGAIASLALPASPWLAVLGTIAEGRFYFFGCFTAAFVLHAWDLDPRTRRRDLLGGAALDLAFFALRSQIDGGRPEEGLGTGLGLWAIGARTVALARARTAAEKSEAARGAFDVVAFTAFAIVTQPYLHLTGTIGTHVYDPLVLRVEAAYGAQPSFVVARALAAVTPLRTLAAIAYLLLPLGLAIVHAARRSRDPDGPPVVLLSFFLIAVAGYPIYYLFPLVGPAAFFAPEFPPAALDLGSLPAEAMEWTRQDPRNCMPSLHTAWALALALETRGLGRGLRAMGVAWFVLVETATLALGEHYLVDLVIALPFAVAIDGWASSKAPTSLRAAWVAIALAQLAAWLAALRFGWAWLAAQPIALWAATAATVALAVAARGTLLAAERRRGPG
jgi:hypothetical protein